MSDFLLKRLDQLLDDEDLLDHVRADLARRYRLTTLHGRHSTPVEVILRLFVLKQFFNWGFEQTEKQVRQSPLLQWFCRVPEERVPDDTTLLRWVQLIRPETRQEIAEQVLSVYTSSKRGRKTQTKSKIPKKIEAQEERKMRVSSYAEEDVFVRVPARSSPDRSCAQTSG
ncbi:MAG: transposase [Ktedonobacteraceae bacterium]|nr:transposase [Ktedonobacteraceae bacterium]